jgi:alkylation response protein AidB-like acyl-CoA dehydrogenase
MKRRDDASNEGRFLAAVARVRGVAEARAAESDRDATLHPEVVAAMRAEGLFGLVAPREVGGAEAGPLVQLGVIEAMAHADSAAGWSLMIGAVTTAMMGAYLGRGAVARIFAGEMPIGAGLHMPMGRARKVEGGFEISGRWAFGSGVRHADWVLTAAVVETGEAAAGAPAMILFAVPAGRVQIERSWDTAMLRGSGSHHYRLEGERVEEAFTAPYPAAPRLRGAAFFELPFVALVAASHIGFALGVAQRALDEVAERVAPHRVRLWSRELMRDGTGFRVGLGRAAAQLAAARALAREVLGEVTARVERGEVLEAADWARVRGATALATEIAAEVATFAFRSGGASALGASSVIERCFRDAHGALQHVAASDEAFDFAARARMGDAPFIPLHLPRPRAEAR